VALIIGKNSEILRICKKREKIHAVHLLTQERLRCISSAANLQKNYHGTTDQASGRDRLRGN
jgi:hypothetical protein